MRTRFGGLAAALALGLGACGSGGATDGAAPPDPAADRAATLPADLVSARDTLPPAPASADALTVVLTHPGGPLDPGLDAAAAVLAQRPDIEVVIAVAAEPGATTMSGFPVSATGETAAAAVGAALDADAADDTDLVVIGITGEHGIGARSAEADAATARGVPVLLVGAGEQPDLAAATLQLLEVLDLELDRLVAGDVHRLAVPGCEHGMLRGRIATRPAATAPTDLRADCTTNVVPATREDEAYAAGYATLTSLR